MFNNKRKWQLNNGMRIVQAYDCHSTPEHDMHVDGDLHAQKFLREDQHVT
jgi:hypothetical protein